MLSNLSIARTHVSYAGQVSASGGAAHTWDKRPITPLGLVVMVIVDSFFVRQSVACHQSRKGRGTVVVRVFRSGNGIRRPCPFLRRHLR